MVDAARCRPNVLSSASLARSFSGKWAPISTTRGRKSGLDFRQNPSAGNRCPIWAARGGESSLLPFGCKLVRLQLGQIRVASTAIHHHLLHSHRLRSRPDQIQNPNSKRAIWILEFGFWSLDFGSWILEFGVWILDQFSLRSFCGGPKRRRLDFGFWILVWMRPQPTSFGSCIRCFHVTPTRVGGFVCVLVPRFWFPTHRMDPTHTLEKS